MNPNELDYRLHIVRAAAILTNSYVAGTVISEVKDANQLIILADFVKGSLTSVEIKVEFSPDGTNYYRETSEAFTAGSGVVSLAERTFAATGAYRIAIPIKDRFIKLSVQGTGTVTSSSIALKAVVGSV